MRQLQRNTSNRKQIQTEETEMTEQEILYNAYNDSGVQTNEEVMALLGWSNDKVRNIKAKLKIRGFIDYTFGSPVKILKPYREVVDAPETLKAQIYREMLEVYMEDFRAQDTFKDRLLVGQEIRMILKCV